MKVALLTKYDNQAASTRHRFDQYQPFLESNGLEIIKKPLFNKTYLQNLYRTNNRDISHIFRSYLTRMLWLVSKPDVDLIWLHCDLFPYMPGILERLVTFPKKPIIYDFDDAIFHNYNLSPKWYVRKFLGSKLHDTIGVAKMAFCGNEYLAKYARSICPKTKIIPTVINTEIFHPIKNEQLKECPVRIGWIGTPTTYNQYLYPKLPMLKDLALKEGCQIYAMGISKDTRKIHPSLKIFEWSEESEIPFIQSLDIGIMPLTNSPWARGKCGFKIIQYMACGLPVVASPVGVNCDIIEHGVNGFLAETDEDWNESIKILLNDKDLRLRMGSAGQKKIVKDFSLKTWGPKVSQIIRSVIEDTVDN
jgi:glycosyltransferase involved in cell wall biosynthesis